MALERGDREHDKNERSEAALTGSHRKEVTPEVLISGSGSHDLELETVPGIVALGFGAGDGMIREALDSLDQGLSIYDRDLRLVVCNKRFAELLGFSEELTRTGTPIAELIRVSAERGEYGPGDADDILQQRLELFARKENWSFEYVRSNGTAVEVEHNFLPNGGLISTFVDITDRKAAAEALNHQAIALEQLDEAVVINDVTPRVIDCNDAAARIFRSDREDLIGQHPLAMMDGQDEWEDQLKSITTRLDQGSKWSGEIRMRRTNGEPFLAELVVAPYFDSDNRRAGSVAVIRDVTARRETEEALRRQAVVMEQLNESVIVTDVENRIIDCNRAAQTLFGYDKMELIGRFPSIFVNDREQRVEILPGVTERVFQEESWAGEVEMRRKDGSVFLAELKLAPLCAESGQTVATIAITRDITERKRREVQLRRQAVVMEQLNDAVFVSALDRRIVECNRALEQMFGHRREEILGKSSIIFSANPKGWSERINQIQEHLAQDKTWSNILELRRKDGVKFLAQTTIAPLWDEKGNPIGGITILKDVTEAKRVEEALRRQAVVMEQLNEAVVVNDLDRKITDCNLAAARMFGYERDEIIGDTPDLFIADSKKWDRNRPTIMERLTRGQEWSGEVELRRKDDSLFLGSLTLASLCDNAGKIIGMVAVVRDITEQRRAEEAIRESEKKYHGLFESIQDGIVVTSLDGKVEGLNKGFTEMIGYTLEDMSRLKPADITPERWWGVEERIFRQIMERGYSDEYEKEYLCKDGALLPVDVRGWLVRDSDGQPVQRMTIIRDITEKKREAAAQTRQMAIIEGTSDLVAMIDKQGSILYLNSAGRKMLGIGIHEDVANFNLMDFHTDRSRDYVREEGLPIVARDGIWRGETVFISRDGDEMLTSQLIISHRESGSNLEFYSTIARDMTERTRHIEELSTAKERAEIANRAKTEFLANMSHELRTPLNAIIGFSKMMQDKLFGELGTPQYEEYTTSIYDSGKHLLGVINDILDLSKIEAGKFEIDEYPVEIGAVIEWCMNTVKPRVQAKQQKLSVDMPEKQPLLMGDERVLRQIVLNLLSNSAKFTSEHGSIGMRVTVEDEGLTISVTDTGIGIPQEKMGQIFQPFGQADGTLSRQFGGTGLGLSITKSLVEMHDGTIDLESEVGVGTRVTLRFSSTRLINQ
ncbi:MAG: PAS domain S-box protein [Sphingomonadales bacterium]